MFDQLNEYKHILLEKSAELYGLRPEHYFISFKSNMIYRGKYLTTHIPNHLCFGVTGGSFRYLSMTKPIYLKLHISIKYPNINEEDDYDGIYIYKTDGCLRIGQIFYDYEPVLITLIGFLKKKFIYL